MNVFPFLQLVSLVCLLALGVFWDIRERRIPNKVTVPGLLVGLFLAGMVGQGLPGSALAGAAAAFALSVPFVIMGGLGAGDAKFLTAIGAYVGVGGLLSVFIFGGMAGGILAMGNMIRRGAFLGVLVNVKNLLLYQITLGRRGERIALESQGAQTVPYGLAIAAGALATWFFPLALGGSL